MNTTFPRMHISLYVADINQTLSFYSAFFGQSPDKVKTGYAKYILAEPSLIISFVENAEKVASGFGHLGFQVEKIEELEERLTQARIHNLPILEERDVACCYAEQDKFWITDPDGYHWEVYYFKADADFNDPRYTLEAKTDTLCCSPTENNVSVEIPLTVSTEKCCTPGVCC